ncbi:MAG: aldo/keto reductase [Treponema sp.]|jgi:aryl-alcohol dehydrogenase-like predicted oxidoreductase|nr:aldo/keto reductase [Treponema sp.]
MKYRKFGNSGIDISVIGLGTWPLGNDFFGEVAESAGIAVIQKALDIGINLIDTSPAYGQAYEAEIAVGKALKGRRDKAVISTKCGVHRVVGVGNYAIPGEYIRCLSPAVVSAELENSLKRLGTDYIDIYFIHWPDLNFGNDGALELLAKWKKEGKIRAGAVSNFNVDQIKNAIAKGEISGIQPYLNIFAQASIGDGIIPLAAEKNLGIMTYGSLGGGILTGAFKEPPKTTDKELRSFFYDSFTEAKWAKCNKVVDTLREIAGARGVSVAEVSINWVLARKGVTTALIGTTKPENLVKNAAAADWELTADELAKINDSYKKNLA